jgi:hypothetical protein
MDGRSAKSRRNGGSGRKSGKIAMMIVTATGRETENGNVLIRWLRMRRCGQSRDGGRGGVF